MNLLLAFLTHFIADFLLQTRDMAKNKSSSPYYLGRHIGVIFLCFLPFGIKFALLNALIHAAIDSSIWKLYAFSVWKRRWSIASGSGWNKKSDVFSQLNEYESKKYLKKYFKYWEDSWFYITIGFDQFLHAATIILLMEFL